MSELQAQDNHPFQWVKRLIQLRAVEDSEMYPCFEWILRSTQNKILCAMLIRLEVIPCHLHIMFPSDMRESTGASIQDIDEFCKRHAFETPPNLVETTEAVRSFYNVLKERGDDLLPRLLLELAEKWRRFADEELQHVLYPSVGKGLNHTPMPNAATADKDAESRWDKTKALLAGIDLSPLDDPGAPA